MALTVRTSSAPDDLREPALQSLEALLAHIPGLTVVCIDARRHYGLLRAAVQDRTR